jgi:hypothetical protein
VKEFMDKLKNSIIQAAFVMAHNMKTTAERLERAANAQDFRALAEISLGTTTSWTLDAIRGAATAVTRIYDAGIGAP